MNSFEIIMKKTNNPTKYKQNAKIEKSKNNYAPFLTKYKLKVKIKPPQKIHNGSFLNPDITLNPQTHLKIA